MDLIDKVKKIKDIAFELLNDNENIDKYDFKFDYYVNLTESNNTSFVFNDGIKIEGFSLSKNFIKLDDNKLIENGLYNTFKEILKDNDKKYLYIIMIPKIYNRFYKNDNNEYFCPIPFLIPTDEYKDNTEILYFNPALIKGLYDDQLENIVFNENYNLNFSPIGCKYSTDQIYSYNDLYDNNYYKWKEKALNRNMRSSNSIKLIDKDKELIKKMNYYKKDLK